MHTVVAKNVTQMKKNTCLTEHCSTFIPICIQIKSYSSQAKKERKKPTTSYSCLGTFHSTLVQTLRDNTAVCQVLCQICYERKKIKEFHFCKIMQKEKRN